MEPFYNKTLSEAKMFVFKMEGVSYNDTCYDGNLSIAKNVLKCHTQPFLRFGSKNINHAS